MTEGNGAWNKQAKCIVTDIVDVIISSIWVIFCCKKQAYQAETVNLRYYSDMSRSILMVSMNPYYAVDR